jgi:hypothetical protein
MKVKNLFEACLNTLKETEKHFNDDDLSEQEQKIMWDIIQFCSDIDWEWYQRE